MGQLVLAHNETPSSPPPQVGQDPSSGPGNPLGTLTKKEIKKMEKENKLHSNDQTSGEISTQDARFYPHTHNFLDIFKTYDGYYDRGELTSGGNSSYINDGSLEYGKTRSYSNSWNVDIGFESDYVSTGVGYSVTASSSDYFSWTMTVRPRKVGHIGGQDWYHTQEYNVRNDYYDNYNNLIGSEYGSGWAAQWYKFHFYDWETDCTPTLCK